MKLEISNDDFTLNITQTETESWAGRTKCYASSIAGKQVRVRCDCWGVRELIINDRVTRIGAVVDLNELDSIVGDFVRGKLPPCHPCLSYFPLKKERLYK